MNTIDAERIHQEFLGHWKDFLEGNSEKLWIWQESLANLLIEDGMTSLKANRKVADWLYSNFGVDPRTTPMWSENFEKWVESKNET